MKFLTSFLALCLLALSTSGCSVNPATGEQSFTGGKTIEDDERIGKQAYPQLIKADGGAYDHQHLQKYVDDIGQRLAKVSELPNLNWRFTVLDHPRMNAWALPGGKIGITRGILSLAESEAEIAAVLGHEIGHVTARHGTQRMTSGTLAQVGSTILGIVIGGPAGDIANLASQAALASYGRDHEMEADMLGIRYMTKLGYDPKASASFFKKLAAHTELQAKIKGQEGKQSHYGIFASHPDTKVRIQASEKIAQDYPPHFNLHNRKTYLSLIDGINYGESVKQGITDGHTFIHPDLRIEFTVPEGFNIVNKPTYVAATHKNGSAMVFDMGSTQYGKLPMTRYLSEIWAKKYTLRDLQSIEINRMEAATGVVTINSKKGVRDIRYIAISSDNKIFQLRFLSPPERTQEMELPFRHATYSFKRLSYREAKAIKGFHIGLHRAGRGDTIGALAKRMKVEKLQEDWLKVLNKEALKDGLQSGETLKLVVR